MAENPVLQNLPGVLEEVELGSCYICLEDFNGPGRAVLMCGHEYCIPCIVRWGGNHNTCPACRQVDANMQVQHILPDARQTQLIAEFRANLDNVVLRRLHTAEHEVRSACQRCSLFKILGIFMAVATVGAIEANTELHDKLADAADKISENAAAAAAANPKDLELRHAADLAARDAAAAHGNIGAINEIANEKAAAASAAMQERINEACARDAAAAAGDPVARQAVEDDKIRATISDPKEMEQWQKDHPPWHSAAWHAKHDVDVDVDADADADAGAGAGDGDVTDAGDVTGDVHGNIPIINNMSLVEDEPDISSIDKGFIPPVILKDGDVNNSIDQFIKEHDSDINHNINHDDVIDQFIKDHESNNVYVLDNNPDDIEHAVDIGHDTYIDHTVDVGHDAHIDHTVEFGDHHYDLEPPDLDHHSFLSDIFHNIHDLFV